MLTNNLFNLPKIKIYKSELSDVELTLYGLISSKGARCPGCKGYSKKIHDRYIRHLNDLSVFEYKVYLILQTRKFKCTNKSCPHKVFSEQTSGISRYARRTIRLDKILDTIALETNSHQGKIISKLVSVSLSRSTMLRKSHKHKLPTIKTPRVLGIDDWAFRKGINYGTVLIDMETSRPVDLLPSRDAKDVKKWLGNHKHIEIVTRDRASSYASATKEVHPNTHQVADRFHLLMNLSDALTFYFKSIFRKIKHLLLEHQNELHDKKPLNVMMAITPKKTVDTDTRLPVFKKVKELQSQKYAARKIAKELGISRNTVRAYFQLESLPARAHHKTTNIDLFTDVILSELQRKRYLKKDIIRKIKDLGYDGSQTQAYYHINRIIRQNHISTPDSSFIKRAPIKGIIKPIPARKLSMLITEDDSKIKDQKEKKYIGILLKESTELRLVRRLSKYFRTMIINREGNVRKWVELVQKSSYQLAGLKNDIVAVENAIKWAWSNGAVEGHVNRIKTIKRQMYGRASFELLRK